MLNCLIAGAIVSMTVFVMTRDIVKNAGDSEDVRLKTIVRLSYFMVSILDLIGIAINKNELSLAMLFFITNCVAFILTLYALLTKPQNHEKKYKLRT